MSTYTKSTTEQSKRRVRRESDAFCQSCFLSCILFALILYIPYSFYIHYHFSILSKQQLRLQQKRQVLPHTAVQYKCKTFDHHPRSYFLPKVNFLLYIVVHDNQSYSIAHRWKKCIPWATILWIPTTKYMDAIVYKELLINDHKWRKTDTNQNYFYDYIAITTYRSLKYINLEKLKMTLELGMAKGYDVIPLLSTGERLVDQAVRGHTTEFIKVWTTFLLTFGYTLKQVHQSKYVEAFLRNTMLIKPFWLNELAQAVTSTMEQLDSVQHAITTTDTHNKYSRLISLLSTDAHYQEAIYRKDVAQKVFGKPYYEWYPFIYERFPAFFLSIHQLDQTNSTPTSSSMKVSVFTTIEEVEEFSNPEIKELFMNL